MADKPSDEKQFSLKPIEVQMLQAFEQSYFGTLSNFLSYLCTERLAYQVTQNTKFRVEKDQLFVSEAPPEEVAANQNDSVSTTNDNTGKALKK